jgi:hypothetical protein
LGIHKNTDIHDLLYFSRIVPSGLSGVEEHPGLCYVCIQGEQEAQNAKKFKSA